MGCKTSKIIKTSINNEEIYNEKRLKLFMVNCGLDIKKFRMTKKNRYINNIYQYYTEYILKNEKIKINIKFENELYLKINNKLNDSYIIIDKSNYSPGLRLTKKYINYSYCKDKLSINKNDFILNGNIIYLLYTLDYILFEKRFIIEIIDKGYYLYYFYDINYYNNYINNKIYIIYNKNCYGRKYYNISIKNKIFLYNYKLKYFIFGEMSPKIKLIIEF